MPRIPVLLLGAFVATAPFQDPGCNESWYRFIEGAIYINMNIGATVDWHSPSENGFAMGVAPPIPFGKSGEMSFHPTATYQRLSFEGGHVNVLYFGGQVRYAPKRFQGRLAGLWFGGEGEFARASAVVTNPLADPDDAGVRHGWRFGGLFGVPVYRAKRADLHFFAAGGISKAGDGGTGPALRFGVQLQPKRRAP